MGLVTVGVDIGQKRDPTAVVVCEGTARATGRHLPAAIGTERGRPMLPGYEIAYEARHLERLPLGTPYPAVAARVAEVVRRAAATVRERGDRDWLRLFVVVDATGVGAPVVDILRAALPPGVRLCAATFTHGDRLDGGLADPEMRVGKAFLVSRLQALFQTERLALPPGHPEAAAMMQELLDYEIRVDADANDRYGAFSTGAHDDLATALGLAVIAEPPPPVIVRSY